MLANSFCGNSSWMRPELMGTQHTQRVRESPGWHMALLWLPHIDPALCSISGKKKKAASSTAPERTFHLKTWHAPLRRVTRSLEDCSYFSFSVLNFHTGFLITALQPVVKCQKNTSCYSNRYLQCNPDVEQVTASFPQCRNNNATLQLLPLSHRFIQILGK